MANKDFNTLLETLKPDPLSLAIMETIDIDRCEVYDPDDDAAKLAKAAGTEMDKLYLRFERENKNKAVFSIFLDYSNHSSDRTAFTAAASYRRGFQDAVLLLQAYLRNDEKK
jgi:hypothetical protein